MAEPTEDTRPAWERRRDDLAKLMDEKLCPACEGDPEKRSGVHDKLGPWTCAMCMGRGTVPEV